MSKNQEKIQKIAHHMNEILQLLGLDTTKGAIKDTPKRVAKMYVEDVFWGLDPSLKPTNKLFELTSKEQAPPLVTIDKIQVQSFCEHHLLPFTGFATIYYVPTKGIIGLSKVNRIVEYYSRKPQVQERLTLEISGAIQEATHSPHVAVRLDCLHFCVCMRGVSDPHSRTLTHHAHGDFLILDHLKSLFWKGVC